MDLNWSRLSKFANIFCFATTNSNNNIQMNTFIFATFAVERPDAIINIPKTLVWLHLIVQFIPNNKGVSLPYDLNANSRYGRRHKERLCLVVIPFYSCKHFKVSTYLSLVEAAWGLQYRKFTKFVNAQLRIYNFVNTCKLFDLGFADRSAQGL